MKKILAIGKDDAHYNNKSLIGKLVTDIKYVNPKENGFSSLECKLFSGLPVFFLNVKLSKELKQCDQCGDWITHYEWKKNQGFCNHCNHSFQ